MSLFGPISRALRQSDDPVFVGVIWRSLGWSALCFVCLHVLTFYAIADLVQQHGVIAWIASVLGVIAASLLALWLFLPAAAGIGMLYLDRIARAVEWRWYPDLPEPAGESVTVQAWDGAVVALKVLALNVLALALALLLPVVGWVLGWGIAAYAIGRGLFVAVAMRRMPRHAAESVYNQNRLAVLAQGAILAAAAYVPLINLLIPVIGTAAMVHLLDQIMLQTAPFHPVRSGFDSVPLRHK